MFPSLSARRTRAFTLTIAAGLAVLFVAPPAHAHASGCAPVAYTPSLVGGHQAQAAAKLPCYGTFEISLRNAAGSTLGSPHSGSGIGNVFTDDINCAGAIVHTFVWVNVSGSVYSDTSGSVQC